MKLYELTYLISPELSESELNSLNEKITSLIQKGGGVLNEAGLPIKKELANQIEKKTEAFLARSTFYLEPTGLEDLEKELKTEKKILRYLILAKKLPRKAAMAPIKKLRKIVKPKPKVELKEIEKKLEEILNADQYGF